MEVGKLDQELQGGITMLGEHTNHLKSKFDFLVQYVNVLEEDNLLLKHTVSQIQLQLEDLENRELCHNLHIRGVPESVGNTNFLMYSFSLTFCLNIPDMVHRSSTQIFGP